LSSSVTIYTELYAYGWPVAFHRNLNSYDAVMQARILSYAEAIREMAVEQAKKSEMLFVQCRSA
jgi:hypothetical protein